MSHGAVSARAIREAHSFPTTRPYGAIRPAASRGRRAVRSPVISGGTERSATRGDNRVAELGWGATVYPPREAGGRWRAVWWEDGERRQCQAVSEGKLAVMLERVAERLAAVDAPFLERPGSELIAFYLSADRLPADRQWSRKHAHTQGRLCERFAAPVIATMCCQDIKVSHMQRIVNAAPTPGEGGRVRGMISAPVGAGLAGGYLISPRLREVHWQAAGRPPPVPKVAVAGESTLFVGPTDIPSHVDVTRSARRWPPGGTATGTS
jgi:hypothetical protein